MNMHFTGIYESPPGITGFFGVGFSAIMEPLQGSGFFSIMEKQIFELEFGRWFM